MILGAPTSTRGRKDFVLLPATRVIQPSSSANIVPIYFQSVPTDQQAIPQIRGPFDFIGQWIQQTPWLPIQINVPDIFQNIGNGINQVGTTVSQFSQNVGNGVSQFSQNVGNGLSQFSQNIGNGFTTWAQNVPILENFIDTKRKPVMTTNGQQIGVLVPIEYPGGQQLVLANEAFEAFP